MLTRWRGRRATCSTPPTKAWRSHSDTSTSRPRRPAIPGRRRCRDSWSSWPPRAIERLVVQTSLARARVALEKVPDGPGSSLGTVRDAIAQRIDTYGPLLDAYVDISERLPTILGWEGPRRYLVLTQNPAELRPTGGYTGSYGIVGFDRGRVTERTFRDVALLDFPWDFPYVEPPPELTNYLLGPNQPWQFADANWSPDFPTSAQDALRLYANESGDDRLDGVLGITTYTIDEFLELTGPIAVPEYDATIASGETTLKALQLTRVARPGENRKAFLSAFADRLFDSLLALPPERWVDVVDQASTFRNQRLLLAWFSDPDDQGLAARGGFDGAVRQDPGDYLYPVDSNVAPASKIHAIATRSLGLEVVIDSQGHARNTLDVTWENPIDGEAGRALRELPTLETITHPRGVLSRCSRRWQPHRIGIGWKPRRAHGAGGRRRRGRPGRDRHVPHGPARNDQPPLRLDEPRRRRLDGPGAAIG